ncbi:MAG: tRNA dimethylallyltransferase, partial [Planctomycetota bacterium]
RPRDERAQRIEQRVDAMMDAGLVDEVRALTSGGRRLGRTASQAVGYREVLEHLAPDESTAGEQDSQPPDLATPDLATTVERIKARTRRFAKRQGTWFRSLSECRFVEIAADESGKAIAERIAAAGHDERPA